jgi:hypothetical protein
MNDYETKNRIIKAIAVQTGTLLEHFQWGKQGSTDQEILVDVDHLQHLLDELRATLREN